jgi:flagellar basal-body rod protein FlgG
VKIRLLAGCLADYLLLTLGGTKSEVFVIEGIQRLAKDMTAKVKRQEYIADNLANAATPGFKNQRAFISQLRTSVSGVGNPRDVQQVIGSYTDFAQGPIEQTHRSLDLAIEGEGFFVLSTPEGDRYTRCGNFTLDADGYLVSQSGHPVMGTSGPIPITGQDIRVTPEGAVVVDNQEIGSIRLVTFGDLQGLGRNGNIYSALQAGARDVDADSARIIQGALERSNVNPIDEMVEMISIHRGFEADQKSINLQDEAAKQLIDRAGRFGG